MNLLTDIIRDVAVSFGLKLTNHQELELQDEVMRDIVRNVSFLKERQIRDEDFPWLEKKRTPTDAPLDVEVA